MITMSEEDAKKTLDALYVAFADPKELIAEIERLREALVTLRRLSAIKAHPDSPVQYHKVLLEKIGNIAQQTLEGVSTT